MFRYRQALVRMGQGDSDREIVAARLMGRRKAGELRQVAVAQGWLDARRPLPEEAQIATVIAAPRRAVSNVSRLELYRCSSEWFGAFA